MYISSTPRKFRRTFFCMPTIYCSEQNKTRSSAQVQFIRMRGIFCAIISSTEDGESGVLAYILLPNKNKKNKHLFRNLPLDAIRSKISVKKIVMTTILTSKNLELVSVWKTEHSDATTKTKIWNGGSICLEQSFLAVYMLSSVRSAKTWPHLNNLLRMWMSNFWKLCFALIVRRRERGW